jgi:cation transport regulator ChaB
LYEKGLIDFDEGQVTALYTGTIAVRAKYVSGQISEDILLGPEGYVVINIIENDKSDLKASIDIAIANLAASDYASKALKASYQAAINAALAVYNDPNASEEEISQAAAAMKLATASFDAKKKKPADEEKEKDVEPVYQSPGTLSVYYSIKAEKCDNGKIELSSAVARKGTSVTVTVTPDNGYEILEVFINGVSYGNRNVITIASINENITVSAVFREIWENPFVDVKESDWFYKWVEEACRAKLFLGTSENTFEPYTPMTRAMLVTVLGRLYGVSPENGADSGFKDVQPGSWYAGFVAWAKENGFVYGIR